MFSIILDQSVKTKDNVPVVIDTIVYQIDLKRVSFENEDEKERGKINYESVACSPCGTGGL